MKKFRYEDTDKYSVLFENVSEPMKEFVILSNGMSREADTSCTLMGVCQNGKWGWIDTNNRLVIPFLYDSGFTQSDNGVIILRKDGLWGGLFRDSLKTAFSFKYKGTISHFYRDTFVVWNNNNRCALMKPVDKMLTDYKYKGFLSNNRNHVTEYVRAGFFGDVTGDIDLETGKELS